MTTAAAAAAAVLLVVDEAAERKDDREALERLRRLKKICDVWRDAACSSVVEFLMHSETSSLVGGPLQQPPAFGKHSSASTAAALVSARSDDTRAPDSPAPFNWNRLNIPPCRIQDEARTSVVLWMGRVIEAMCWPMGTFFTAVHALDTVLAVTSGDPLIPLLSTACVLVGVSSECDHKQVAKARRFVGRVPNVRSVSEIVCKQLAVVAALTRGSLVNKTPLDFLMIFLTAAHIVLENEYNVPFWNLKIDLGPPAANAQTHRSATPSLLDYILSLPPAREDRDAAAAELPADNKNTHHNTTGPSALAAGTASAAVAAPAVAASTASALTASTASALTASTASAVAASTASAVAASTASALTAGGASAVAASTASAVAASTASAVAASTASALTAGGGTTCCLVECMVDFVLAMAVHCYLHRQYIVVRGSHFVAALIMDILVHFHPHFMAREKTDSVLREAALERFCLKVFRMPMFEIQPMWNDLPSLYKEAAAAATADVLLTPAGRFFQWPSAAEAMLKKILLAHDDNHN